MTSPEGRRSRLGSFELLGKLGEGGMGEVYRARDTRLGREVAVKILPDALLPSRDQVVRFEREARLLAGLTHPRIATLYDVGEDDGVRFIVMELVRGETLADRLVRGPIPPDDAIPIAMQITEALEAAHQRGVVHRDLKPANVMVADDGLVKVLDFGVAKALLPDPRSGADDGADDAPTRTSDATADGFVVGTAAYMSPEQARGTPVDERADVWAFGCVLFEMLTGARPFTGESPADVLSRVLASEPDWTALPEQLPSALRRLLHRCLRKDPARRLHHMADVRIELAEAADGESGRPERPGSKHSAALWMPLALGALLGAGAMWTGAWTAGRSAPPLPQPVRWSLDVSLVGQLALGGRSDPLAVSADGRMLAFVARDVSGVTRLFLRPLDAMSPVAIPGSDGASNPFFSPDGSWVGFFAGARLRKAAVGGGTPVDLAAVPLDNLGATWGRHGTIVFASYASGLWSVDENGGDPELLTDAGGAVVPQHRWPSFLPDGNRVLFSLQTDEGPRLAIFDLRTGARVAVPGVQEVIKARYLPSGHLVMAQAGALMTAPFDPDAGRLLGTPRAILSDLSMLVEAGAANFEVSPGGTLIYLRGASQEAATMVWLDRDGRKVGSLPDPAAYVHPRLSPDGTRLAVEVGSEVGDRHVEVFDLQRGTRSVLASESRAAQPVWHPDGNRLAVAYEGEGAWDLQLLGVGLPGAPEPLITAPLEQWLGAFTPSGETLVFYQVDPVNARDIWVLDVGSRQVRPFRATSANERGVRLSPGGDWLAYVSDESGRDEVYVESFPEPGRRRPVSTSGGTEPVWARDGRELFYRQGQRLMSVVVSPEGEIAPGPPRLLFVGSYDLEIVGNANYDVAPDGRFLMIERDQATAANVMVVIGFEPDAPPAGGGP